MGKTTDLSPFEKGFIVCASLAEPRFRRQQISLCCQKQSYQRFSKVGIRTQSPSLEDVTAVREHFSKSVIRIVSDELCGRTGTLLCFS
ncbi:hypothetical protein TNCV_3084651 [Trichonephila clavipes]|nr:hypothetical protein TNCV_3084651 [Trichonephila clavipes]